MSCMYVAEQGSKIINENGKFIVECKDGMRRIIPEATLESIVIFGNSVLTLPAQKKCLSNGIDVSLFGRRGHYFGRMVSTGHVNVRRFKNQVYISDNEKEKLKFAKLILDAKIHNQIVVAKRYLRYSVMKFDEEVKQMNYYRKKLQNVESISEAIGYEGYVARIYFSILSAIVNPDFKFKGRNRRPPKDPFNSMLSLGYTILFYTIYSELESRGINPYIGYIHRIKENHPALVSDLLEEWRAVIVDSTVLNLIQGNEIRVNQFIKHEENEGVFLTDEAMKIFISKLERKMRSNMNYLEYIDKRTSFRRAIWWQIKSLAKCIDENDLSNYHPLRIK